MPYGFDVSVSWAPAYELVVSLTTYADYRKNGRMLETGPDWVAKIKQRGGRELASALAAASPFEGSALELLVWLAPEPRSAERFIAWLASRQPAELYDLLLPQIEDATREAIVAAHKPSVRLLEIWNRVYFAGVDQRILTGLAANAAATKAKLAAGNPAEIVEEVTNGLCPETGETPRHIVLVPQYHFRPLNLTAPGRSITGLLYPAEVLPLAPGELPLRLKWLTRALSDGSRLQILRYVAVTPRRFSDIVQYSGLAKSTVHHHLLTLRAAGLVRAHDAGRGTDRYSLRTAAIESIGPSLLDYVRGEGQ